MQKWLELLYFLKILLLMATHNFVLSVICFYFGSLQVLMFLIVHLFLHLYFLCLNFYLVFF